MNRREFLKINLGLVAIALFPSPAKAQYKDRNSNKVSDDLEEMIRNGTYKRYKGMEDIADVLILYHSTPSDEDVKAIYRLSKQPLVIYNKVKAIRAGLPKDKIYDYARRENVQIIIPDPVRNE